MNKKTKVWMSILALILFTTIIQSCEKNKEVPEVEPSNNLAIDSLVASKTNVVVWEEIYITAYTRGSNLSYLWSTNHGSMLGQDSITVKYWACPTCLGSNTVKCEVSNEYGMVSDTITIHVSD
jgi:hypothetical protein